MQYFPCWGSSFIRRYLTKFSRRGVLAPGILAHLWLDMSIDIGMDIWGSCYFRSMTNLNSFSFVSLAVILSRMPLLFFFFNSTRIMEWRIILKDGVYTVHTRCRRWRWSGDRACVYTRPQCWWPRSVNRLGKAPRWRTSVSTAPFTFSLTSCTSHGPLSPILPSISDFHELATSRDEYKRIVGETELPVMIIVCSGGM